MKALILGGTGGIGSAISNRFIEHGIEVVAVGHLTVDLSNSASIDSFIAKEGKEFDILIHSAGFNVPKSFTDCSGNDFIKSLEINTLGFLHIARACVPYWEIQKSGKILAISSLYGIFARKGRMPYVIAKHALVGAIKTLAIELAPIGVLANSISPGFINTRMTYANNSSETIEKIISGIPLHRLGTPEDVADLALFLCSSNNQYITGQDIIIDGGYSIGGFQN